MVAVRRIIRMIGAICRQGTLGILSSIRRDLTFDEVERRFDALSPGMRLAVSTAIVAGLFGLSLLFAQAGFLGIALFLGLMFLLIR